MPTKTFVRRNRKRWALSQDDLAMLLDVTQSIVSRCETGAYTPELELALGLQVVFGRAPRALFPALYRTIEERVMREASKMDRSLKGRTDRLSATKRQLLAAMIERSAPHEA